ncbi:hypothetical protein DY000_02015628 [Brassica cretica]|uniref:Aminotransferase-like plant mobile domain-containing protein n=1 Tax=Brassica cretica TaxID=69181 RepID=A0ABQ7D6L6_BRACR|nr:hypothetical protein DY000_02015628 [Brassica cretica]
MIGSCNPEVAWRPRDHRRRRLRGSSWILRSRLGPGGPWGPYQTTQSVIWDPEVFSLGPGTETGAWRQWVLSFLLESYWALEAMLEPGGLDPEIIVWNPEILRSFDWNSETMEEPGGTVLRLPRKDYYRYLFGFRILPLGSWPLSSSYAVFYFCRKSLTGLEGAGVGVMTQVPGLLCFPRLEKQDLDCSLYFTVLLQ